MLALRFCGRFFLLALRFSSRVQAEQGVEEDEEGFEYHGYCLVSIPAAAAKIGGWLRLATALILYFCAGFILLALSFSGWVEAEQGIQKDEESFDHHGVVVLCE